MLEWLIDKIKSEGSAVLLVMFSWGIGFTVLVKTVYQFNLDSPEKIHQYRLLFLFLSIGLIFLPFLKSVKIGNWLELSREVKETKEEVKSFKQEIRQTVSMLSNTVNASMKNEFNFFYPDTDKKGEQELNR
jgi:hypothetical protein